MTGYIIHRVKDFTRRKVFEKVKARVNVREGQGTDTAIENTELLRIGVPLYVVDGPLLVQNDQVSVAAS